MDHDYYQWIDDQRDSRWPVGRGGLGVATTPMPKDWGRDIDELKRKILGPKVNKPVNLEALKNSINSKYHN